MDKYSLLVMYHVAHLTSALHMIVFGVALVSFGGAGFLVAWVLALAFQCWAIWNMRCLEKGGR